MIPAGSSLRIESEAPANRRWTLTGWADVISSRAYAGFAIFRQRGPDGRDSEGTAPLEGTTLPGLVVPFDNSDGFSTGVAIVNTGADRATVVALGSARRAELILGQFGAAVNFWRGHAAVRGGRSDWRPARGTGERSSFSMRGRERSPGSACDSAPRAVSRRYRRCRLRHGKPAPCEAGVRREFR